MLRRVNKAGKIGICEKQLVNWLKCAEQLFQSVTFMSSDTEGLSLIVLYIVPCEKCI